MDAIRPWLVSGGATAFVIGEGFDPRPAGYQLVAQVYVGLGSVGWLKQLEVGPYCPPQLADPWNTVGGQSLNNPSWNWFTAGNPPFDSVRAAAQHGIYTTPLGWLSYQGGDPATQPLWEFTLRMVPGDTRKRRVAFDASIPSTWPWQPGIPVPASAYAATGLPGLPLGYSGGWDWNPFQACPGAGLQLHGLIPEDTSLCLFARWRQNLVQPFAFGGGEGYEDLGGTIYPLLPSYGRMLGYVQPNLSLAGQDNALHGWGG